MHKERTARRISFQISTLRTRKKEQHSGRSGGKTKLQKYPQNTHTHKQYKQT
jgi:nucleoside-triphosphatase THEP1